MERRLEEEFEMAALPDGPVTRKPSLRRRPRRPRPTPAGFWLRLAAYMLDSVVLAVAILPLMTGVLQTFGGLPPGPLKSLVGLALVALIGGGTLAYYVGFLAWKGATPGKMAFGMRVERVGGGRVGFWQACGRYLGWGLSYWLFGLGFLVAPARKDRRALHDLIAGTRVVYTA